MIFSKEQIFSDDQALTATAVSDNVIDLGPTGTVYGNSTALVRDIGPGEPIEVQIQLTEDSGGTTPTIAVELQIDTVEGFGSPEVVARSAVLSDGVAGDRLSINYIPQGTDQRYMRLNYVLTGTSPTYTVTSGVVCGAQTNG